MASMGGFDINFGGLPPVTTAFDTINMDGDEYVSCTKCGYGGCDVRVSICGCTLHARCIELNSNGPLDFCPHCQKPTQGLVLFPMSFREIDEAHRLGSALPSAPKNRGRKRKSGFDPAEEKGTYVSDRRAGRWTNEEMLLCDKLMAKFATGELPVMDGMKLNEFLGAMLKSKQSRLTKKMKNAKLSTKSFQRTTGYLDTNEAREFSELEEAFFQALTDPQERAEMKFHMQKEWRENLSRICAKIGQNLDADAWLSSVEEMDRRASAAKDAARMTKRKLMMGVALKHDSQNSQHGVFIDKTEAEARAVAGCEASDEDELFNLLSDDKTSPQSVDFNGKSSHLHSAPFLAKVTHYMQRHNVPFEHVDVWVPSFVNTPDDQGTTCRLCYAGSSTVEKLVELDGKKVRDLTTEEQFNFYAFGDYSQKFSFDVGCGLPGRVYESGRPTWEQSVQNAPHDHFERCGGALQWNIKTVVGIPIASPNVGRIVVTLYSSFDRTKDEDLVNRLSEEFTRLMPSPKWKLVVDIGDTEESPHVAYCDGSIAHDHSISHGAHDIEHTRDSIDMAIAATVGSGVDGSTTHHDTVGSAFARDSRLDEVIALLGEFMPSDPNSGFAPYVPGFMSLRLLLLRPAYTNEDRDLIKTMLDSYSSYAASGRDRCDIAVMLARDFMFLSQQSQHVHDQPPFLNLGRNVMSSAPATAHSTGGLSLFGLPSINSSPQNSPALTPIPLPGSHDSMSIVSN